MKKYSDFVPVVLTHIGKNEFPMYIYDCIEQIRLFNKSNNIYIVVNRNVKHIDLVRLDFYKCSVIYIEDLRMNERHRLFLKKTRLQKFWRVTMERFFILEEVMRDYGLSRVLHLENDNLIYFNIEDVFDVFEKKYSGITMPRDKEDRCIAGIVFLNDIDTLKKLNTYLLQQQRNKKSNEMQLLGEFFIENDIESLPVVSLAYSGKWKIKGVEKQYNYAVLDFQGIFDAAAIGQLLGGKDKRSYKDIINGKYGTVQNTEVVPLVN